MISVDVEDLRRKSPSDRLLAIADLRKRIEDTVRHAQHEASQRLAVLADLQEETSRELTVINRVEIPKDKDVKVEQLFKRKETKPLEETLDNPREEQPRVPETAWQAPGEHKHLLERAYDFTERKAYERIADLRNKAAAGEELSAAERKTVQYYGELMQSLQNVKREVKDEDTRQMLTRSEHALKQIQKYEK